ncbi:MAG: HAD-IC family P-type ATPase [Thermomicrobiales bacterium]
MTSRRTLGERSGRSAATRLLSGRPIISHSDTYPGLSSTEAQARLARDGPNLLPSTPPPPVWREIMAQMVHFFAVMLWIAGGLAILAGLPQLGIAIFVIIIVNGVFAFAQEYRAERAAERLRDLLPRKTIVRRDGIEREIDARDLVVGDVVVLSPGDRISADLELVDADRLSLNTSLLTGESVPLVVDDGEPAYAGTFVVEGEGMGVVSAIGSSTRLAAIAQLAQAPRRRPTPLAQELHRLVRTIATIAVGVGIAFLFITILIGSPASDALLFSIGVTVALVPEGLLPTVTLSLAIGAQRMAERNALVRRLESVETLGSTTFICTDKTGTLTQNQMSVVEVWTPGGTATISGKGYRTGRHRKRHRGGALRGPEPCPDRGPGFARKSDRAGWELGTARGSHGSGAPCARPPGRDRYRSRRTSRSRRGRSPRSTTSGGACPS